MISNPQTNPVSPRQMPPPHQPQPQQRQTNEPQNSNQGQNIQAGPHAKHRHKHITKSWTNPSFIGANIAIVGFSFWFLYEQVINTKPSFWIMALVVYSILFVLTYWAYWMTVCSDPGRVPFYYGYTPQLNLQMPRRYCLMCHNFKPERTHHCSSCKRCVLNMDHHCPWVNNCIGFHNRKYFILFLIYISLGLLFALIISIILLVQQINKSIQTNKTDIHLASKIIFTLVALPLTFALISFTFFHIKMVLNNTTTLQGIIKKKKIEGEGPVDDYDVGAYENYMEVFGENFVCWPCPMQIPGPKGNGIEWLKLNNVQNDHTNQYQSIPLSTQEEYKNHKKIDLHSRY